MQRKIQLVFLIFVVKVTLIDAYHCPFVPENGYEWIKGYKQGFRCILRCEPGYAPSGCHVLRKERDTWNHDVPDCVKESLVSGKTLFLVALGFGTTGVTLGSVASYYQRTVTANGSLFKALQRARAAGVAATTKGVIDTATSTVTDGVNAAYNLMTCERE